MKSLFFALIFLTMPLLHATTAMSRVGKPQYSFLQLVNPKAPTGGILRLATVGTFDSLNHLSIKGLPVQYMTSCYESLMFRATNEPFTLYALLAEKVDIAPDYSRITFYLNKNARFQDNTPVTTADIQTTIDTLVEKSLPRYRNLFKRVKKIIVHDTHTIEFQLNPIENPKCPTNKASCVLYDPDPLFSLSLIPIFSKKQLESIDFVNSGITPLIGTGPYKVKSAQPGKLIVFEKNKHYWGINLPHAIGKFNFDTVSIEYFQNNYALFQGFLAKEFDIFFETNPQQWRLGYKGEAIQNGAIVKAQITHKRPVTVRTIVMNARRSIFQNLHFRQALVLAFNPALLNQLFFNGEMQVPSSLFANTVLAHQGSAQGQEKERLEKYKDMISTDFLKLLLSTPFSAYISKPYAASHRASILKADRLLNEAGYHVKKGIRHTPEGQPVVLSLMIKDEKLDKIALHLRRALKKLGIHLFIKKCDSNQYENNVLDSNFDMIIHQWSNSLSPGIEQAYYFGQKKASVRGSSNYIGLKDPVAESLAQDLAKTTSYDDLISATRALDRYVMHLCFQIPLSYDNKLRFAYWKDRVAFPALNPNQDMDILTRGWTPYP